MIGSGKEVLFSTYCGSCVHKEVSESDPNGACWDCLEHPVNQDSHKPVNYKPKDEQVK